MIPLAWASVGRDAKRGIASSSPCHFLLFCAGIQGVDKGLGNVVTTSWVNCDEKEEGIWLQRFSRIRSGVDVLDVLVSINGEGDKRGGDNSWVQSLERGREMEQEKKRGLCESRKG